MDVVLCQKFQNFRSSISQCTCEPTLAFDVDCSGTSYSFLLAFCIFNSCSRVELNVEAEPKLLV